MKACRRFIGSLGVAAIGWDLRSRFEIPRRQWYNPAHETDSSSLRIRSSRRRCVCVLQTCHGLRLTFVYPVPDLDRFGTFCFFAYVTLSRDPAVSHRRAAVLRGTNGERSEGAAKGLPLRAHVRRKAAGFFGRGAKRHSLRMTWTITWYNSAINSFGAVRR
jgi:hypothetical protein